MIIWICGARKSGKSTLANQLADRFKVRPIILDGDEIRDTLNVDLGFSDKDRYENNIRIAKYAKKLEAQGHDIIVATILPDIDDLRERVYFITGCKFIEL